MSKIKLEDIIEAAKENHWKVISTEYKNLKTEMTFECPKSHLIHETWGKMRDNFVCSQCEDKKIKDSCIKIKEKKEGVTRVLALDDATNTTGWAIFDNKELVICSTIVFSQKDTIERISRLRNWLIEMINSWQIDKIAIEDIQLQNFSNKYGQDNPSVRTFKILAQLQGALLVTCFEEKIPYEIIHVSTWRSFCNITEKTRAEIGRASCRERV